MKRKFKVVVSLLLMVMLLNNTEMMSAVSVDGIQGNVRGKIDGVAETKKDTKLKISFTGDCLISTYKGGTSKGSFNWCVDNYGCEYFLDNVRSVFESDDLTVVNCETVLSDNKLSPRDKGENPAYWYIGPSRNVRVFTSSSVEVASVANNHTRDYGDKGAVDTVEVLRNAGIDVMQSNVPIYIDCDGVTIGFLGCGSWYSGCESALISIVKEMESKSDFQVIYPHGGKERVHQPENWRVKAYRALIDNGADLVVANHPHVLQPLEKYNGKTIIYSLGNFCFGDEAHAENRTLIYQCILDKNNLSYEDNLIPFYVYSGDRNNWQPVLMEESDVNYNHVIDFMLGKRDTPV